MIVVSDASPLIRLAVVGHFDLLRQLYSVVLVPECLEVAHARPKGDENELRKE